MKKLKFKTKSPRKLIVRRESIAQLTQIQLDHVAGGSMGCSLQPLSCNHSDIAGASCVEQ
jgi:hypothetical protein